MAELRRTADAAGGIDWEAHMIDGTIVRAHRHAAGAKRMARPVRKWFRRSDIGSLHQRIRSQGSALAKMEIRASRAS